MFASTLGSFLRFWRFHEKGRGIFLFVLGTIATLVFLFLGQRTSD